MEYHLSIDDVAKRTGLTAYTLRYCERNGLIASTGRASGGQRCYAALGTRRCRIVAGCRKNT